MELKPIRRVVTGHDKAGRAVVQKDSEMEARSNPAGTSALTLLWTTSGLPVDNEDPTDGADLQVGLTNSGGTVLRVVDLLPGTSAPMHRTSSLDYGIVLSGTAELLLDDGHVTALKPGDIVIQRGTIHGWRNPSTEQTARIAFVLLDARPVTVEGVALPDILPGAPTPAARRAPA